MAYWPALGALPLPYELWYKPKLLWQRCNLRDTLRIEQLAELREKTEAVSGLLLSQLRGHLETIRPLLAPRRLLRGLCSIPD